MKRPTVLLADDHRIVVDGLRSLLKDDFDLVDIVTDGVALIESTKRLRPDVIVTDLAMPGLNALDVLRELTKLGIPSRVIVLTMHTDAQLASEAFRLGAAGYLLKSSAGEELLTAIREVLQGRAYMTPLITKDVIAAMASAGRTERAPRPTVRQRQVLRLIAEGKRVKEIAAILNVSPRTVETHKYEMMHVLGVHSMAELIQYALRNPDAGI
jgi:DNA-binding NarL/FixJ family response regulator